MLLLLCAALPCQISWWVLLSAACVAISTNGLLSLSFSGPVVTEDKIQEAKLFYQMHFKQAVFDEEGWRKILEVFRGFHLHLINHLFKIFNDVIFA